MRTTPDNITSLTDRQVFVFGSNMAGRHGAGAAKQAMKWGAVYGQGFGHHGQTYAIPTKDYHLKLMPLRAVAVHLEAFAEWARRYTAHDYLVTEIGCGLAGYKPEQVAPLFGILKLHELENVWLPKRFLSVINAQL